MQSIDDSLSGITMYRLMLYYLIFLVSVASILSFLKILPYNGLDILLEAVYLVAICWIANKVFSRLFKVKTNLESTYITALILTLIMGPNSPLDNYLPLAAAAVLAIASKYLIAPRKKHIFNPAGFGALAAGVLLGFGASWWVGSQEMFPFILVGGLLVLKKIRRFKMTGVFLLITLVISLMTSPSLTGLKDLLLISPIIFFACVMLPEPLTSPYKSNYQLIYASLVAVLFNIYGRFLTAVPFPLELALLSGNVFSYMVTPAFNQLLELKEKKKLTHDVIAFQFEPMAKFDFKPGQYLEWTLSHPNPDSRGVRRFFTISSSPTEDFVMLTSKFYEKPSTFKQTLQKLEPGDEIGAAHLSGEFILPEDTEKKLVFIAGGIGVTPFRSMVKWLIDNREKRDIVLLFSNKTEQDQVFKDIFDAAKELGVRTVYVNTDKDEYIDEKMIKKEMPDWQERLFYVSGPQPMVLAMEEMFEDMGIQKSHIRVDYFPGYTAI